MSCGDIVQVFLETLQGSEGAKSGLTTRCPHAGVLAPGGAQNFDDAMAKGLAARSNELAVPKNCHKAAVSKTRALEEQPGDARHEEPVRARPQISRPK
ncbi:hypothetical protein MRX96_058327 [Rhipicephalus microplus]